MKKYRYFLSKNFPSLDVKISIYLNRCVFVMKKRILEGALSHAAAQMISALFSYSLIVAAIFDVKSKLFGDRQFLYTL